jgi:hypothetical protein
MSVTNELCGGGKIGVGFGPSVFMHRRAFMLCHPERGFGAKDLCSWTVPPRQAGGIAALLKLDITLSSLQRAAALGGIMVGTLSAGMDSGISQTTSLVAHFSQKTRERREKDARNGAPGYWFSGGQK